VIFKGEKKVKKKKRLSSRIKDFILRFQIFYDDEEPRRLLKDTNVVDIMRCPMCFQLRTSFEMKRGITGCLRCGCRELKPVYKDQLNWKLLTRVKIRYFVKGY